jgi:hypothetical protein
MKRKTERTTFSFTKEFAKKLSKNAKAKKLYKVEYIEWLVGLHEKVEAELKGATITDLSIALNEYLNKT